MAILKFDFPPPAKNELIFNAEPTVFVQILSEKPSFIQRWLCAWFWRSKFPNFIFAGKRVFLL